MCYSLSRCLYSRTASGDLSTVLPLTGTSGGKPLGLAHSAHALFPPAHVAERGGTERLKAAPSSPDAHALPNEAVKRFLAASKWREGPFSSGARPSLIIHAGHRRSMATVTS